MFISDGARQAVRTRVVAEYIQVLGATSLGHPKQSTCNLNRLEVENAKTNLKYIDTKKEKEQQGILPMDRDKKHPILKTHTKKQNIVRLS